MSVRKTVPQNPDGQLSAISHDRDDVQSLETRTAEARRIYRKAQLDFESEHRSARQQRRHLRPEFGLNFMKAHDVLDKLSAQLGRAQRGREIQVMTSKLYPNGATPESTNRVGRANRFQPRENAANNSGANPGF